MIQARCQSKHVPGSTCFSKVFWELHKKKGKKKTGRNDWQKFGNILTKWSKLLIIDLILIPNTKPKFTNMFWADLGCKSSQEPLWLLGGGLSGLRGFLGTGV